MGCKKEINGMTGLQELDKLRAHFRRVHHKEVDMMEAMNIRRIAEGIDDAKATENNQGR
jgi:hypothetical protein